jgi:hypothetical protein
LARLPVTFRLTATLRELELSSLGKIENVLKIKLLASRKPAMIAVELLLAGGIQHFLFLLFFEKS